jgi:hypothetical protein
MSKPFCYDRRYGYFAEQDIAPDHRFALMRWSGHVTTWDDVQAGYDRLHKRVQRYFGRNPRPDRKRQKRNHRHD